MVVTISCHLGLLMVLLRPVAPSTDMTSVVENDTAALDVRFISLPRLTATPPASPSPRRVAPQKALVKETVPPPAQRIMHVALQPPKANSTNLSLPPVAPVTPTNNQASTGDRGFRSRLLNAQHSQDIRGVPGSDKRVAPGVELIDPMSQGVGAVMRGTQRLFGVTNRHCIDVGVWQNLTPDELNERHLSPADVEKAAQKYNCYRPLGLNF
ncbi:hypothetical protein SAMN05216570_2559 [Dyella sp. OK004]|nr:hypothetical protein SAMN05216570_2559 [Dyella sp. OK004]